MKLLKCWVIPAICVLATSACQGKGDSLTNEQLILLFGRKPIFASDREVEIPKSAVDCLRLISGVDGPIYKDAPAELVGRLKTECRREFEETLRNRDRNRAGLALSDLESASLAERVTGLKRGIDKERERKTEADRLEKAAKVAAESAAALVKAAGMAREFSETLEVRFQDIDANCSTWKTLKERVVKANNLSKFRWRLPPTVCGSGFRANIQSQVASTSKILAQLKGKPGPFSSMDLPNLFYIENFTQAYAALKADLAEMESARSN